MARHKSNLLLRPGVELEKWRETALHSMESRGRDRDRVFPIIHVKVLARVAFACYGEILEALLRSIEIFQLVLDAFHKGKSKVFACFLFFRTSTWESEIEFRNKWIFSRKLFRIKDRRIGKGMANLELL